jgi:hypothetical protein
MASSFRGRRKDTRAAGSGVGRNVWAKACGRSDRCCLRGELTLAVTVVHTEQSPGNQPPVSGDLSTTVATTRAPLVGSIPTGEHPAYRAASNADPRGRRRSAAILGCPGLWLPYDLRLPATGSKGAPVGHHAWPDAAHVSLGRGRMGGGDQHRNDSGPLRSPLRHASAALSRMAAEQPGWVRVAGRLPYLRYRPGARGDPSRRR